MTNAEDMAREAAALAALNQERVAAARLAIEKLEGSVSGVHAKLDAFVATFNRTALTMGGILISILFGVIGWLLSHSPPWRGGGNGAP